MAGGDFISFWAFFQTFVALNKLSIVLTPHHKRVCDTLQQAVLGQLGKSFVIINIPPRFGKTKICEALACWQLAYFPDSHMIYTSYSYHLAESSVRYVRETIAREWYAELFPQTKLSGVQKADYFDTSEGGRVYGAGAGGAITGFGAGLKRQAGGFIIIDDPIKPDEAMSEVVSESTNFWFENTLKSRRNSPHVPIILCMQRLSEQDLSGYILENYPGDVELIKVAALDPVTGESIMPETVSTKSLRDTEKVNPFAFNAQYQQEPIILGGNVLKTDWFKYYKDDPATMNFEWVVITCDTALQTKRHNDWSVLQVWGRLQRRAYLMDHVRGRFTSPELLSVAGTLYEKWNRMNCPVSKFLIEKAAAGPGLIQQLQLLGIPAEGIDRVKDKVARLMDVLAFFRTGMAYLPADALFNKEILAECAAFRADGLAKHDDIVDTMVDGVGELLGSGLSILDVLGPARKAPHLCAPKDCRQSFVPLPEPFVAAIRGMSDPAVATLKANGPVVRPEQAAAMRRAGDGALASFAEGRYSVLD